MWERKTDLFLFICFCLVHTSHGYTRFAFVFWYKNTQTGYRYRRDQRYDMIKCFATRSPRSKRTKKVYFPRVENFEKKNARVLCIKLQTFVVFGSDTSEEGNGKISECHLDYFISEERKLYTVRSLHFSSSNWRL